MEKAPKNLYIVIPAGGVGTRLWPRSRKETPKQFLKLLGEKSIIQEAVKRLEGFISPDKLFVVAHDRYKQILFQQLPNFLAKNYISEPEKRGTSAAIGLSAIYLKRRDPKAIIHFLVCDDYAKDTARFQRMIALAAETAEKEKALVVYGVKPTYPATGYGYIQVSDKTQNEGGVEVFNVRRFVEKPDEKTAEKFLKSGDYFWHGSGFTARVDVLLEEMKRKWSKGSGSLAKIEQLSDLPADLEEGKIAELYHQIEEIAIEYSVLEKADKVMMVTLESTWRDIGNWKVVYDISKKDKEGNVVIQFGEKGEFIGLDAKNNLVQFDDQLVAAIGVENLIIVDTGDAILICNKDRAEDVKKLVEFLKEKKKVEYL